MRTDNFIRKSSDKTGRKRKRLLEEAAESSGFAVFAAILFQFGILLFIGSLLCSLMDGLLCWFERRRSRISDPASRIRR